MGRRIGGAGGGSDPGPKKGAGVVVAVGAAIAVAASGGAIGGGAATSSVGSAAESALTRDLGAKKLNGTKAAQRGDIDGAWLRMGMRGLKRAARTHLECVVHSVGQVRGFLAGTPCKRLDRILLTVGDSAGNTLVIAISWVEFRNRSATREFLDLCDTDGTGYVTPLGGAVLAMADVELTGQHYSSRRTGTIAIIAEAEPVTGQFDDAVLDAVAEVASWLPRQ